jgi:hypothetical protein
MSTNSNLEILVNLGFNKEEANAALKQGNFNSSLNILLGNIKNKYYAQVIKIARIKRQRGNFLVRI